MTDTDTATAPADAAPDAPEGAAATDDTTAAENAAENGVPAEDADADAGNPANREAAKWRTKFRESEQQIADLTATVERLQRGQVAAAIEQSGLKPAAVFAVAELKDLLAEDGTPDSAKITAAAKTARDQLGIQAPNTASVRVTGMRSGAGVSPPRKDGWSSAFGPRDN